MKDVLAALDERLEQAHEIIKQVEALGVEVVPEVPMKAEWKRGPSGLLRKEPAPAVWYMNLHKVNDAEFDRLEELLEPVWDDWLLELVVYFVACPDEVRAEMIDRYEELAVGDA